MQIYTIPKAVGNTCVKSPRGLGPLRAGAFHRQTWQNGSIHVTLLYATHGWRLRSKAPKPSGRRRPPFRLLTFSPSSSPLSRSRERPKHVLAVGSRAPRRRAGRDRRRRRCPGAEAPAHLVGRRWHWPPGAAPHAPRLPDSEQGPLPRSPLLPVLLELGGWQLGRQPPPAMCLRLCRAPVETVPGRAPSLETASDRIRASLPCLIRCLVPLITRNSNRSFICSHIVRGMGKVWLFRCADTGSVRFVSFSRWLVAEELLS